MILNNRKDFNAHCFVDSDGLHYANYDNLRITSVFQPILNSDQSPYAYEALARFTSETSGETIRPDFLFNSEQVEIVKKINIDRLSRAIHVRNFAQSNVAHLKLFLNVLPVSGEYNAFMAIKATLLEKRLSELGMTTDQVVMEIVESAGLDEQLLVEASVSMRDSGFQVALDDFGVQSSDFNRLKLIKPDIVKIDRSLLLSYMEGKRAALRDTVQITRFIGAKSVVEGVENAKQYKAMKALGIDFFQGYLFARPVPLPCVCEVK
ncbi:putative Diguanylate phosphodiesterase [Vibrio nigripulchritudo SOn1]|uniref:Diguanylate phosphodiesterase n=1 Tax=Vibrio nigripulchritudo SOn1 TaxID=1238450 RepID=A0AAV2VMS8_9VIBR|nr:putative Diguanylate phosphodiesterase [Vibrio nigripulchritudo SOn1]